MHLVMREPGPAEHSGNACDHIGRQNPTELCQVTNLKLS